MPTADQLTETLTHACSIADQFAGDWAVVLYDSTYPAGVDRDRPTRVHPRPTADAPDDVPGGRWDSGQGSQRGKDACANAAALVVVAHRLAGQAIGKLSEVDHVELSGRPARDAGALRHQTFKVVARLRWLLKHDVAHGGLDAQLFAHSAAVQLLEAHAAVKGLMRDFDAVGELPAERRCWNCQREARPGGRECAACNRYRLRAEAQIRAGKVVKHRLRPVPRFAEAHDALRRRTERLRPGQLDIEGPLPGGTYREGEWAPASPLPDETAPRGAKKEAS